MAAEAPLYYQGVSRSSAAFRILKQMGWEEGEGLGKEKQGITQHIRVINKKDNSGVGVDAQQKAANNWAFNTVAFDSILKNLKVIVAVDTKEEDSNEVTNDKNEDKEKQVHSIKLTRPQGRYKKREAGKSLQGKSQADLAAILGYTSSPTVFETEFERISNTSDLTQNQERVTEDKTCVQDSDRAMAVNVITVDTPDWWGHKHGFVRAGAVGQKKSHSANAQDPKQDLEVAQLNCRTSFCEQDQENLYNLVQGKASKARQGVGIADRPKKIGGALWKGQKVSLDSDSDEEVAESNDNPDADKRHGYNASKDMKSDRSEFLVRDGKRKAAKVGHLDADETRKVKRFKEEENMQWKKLCKQVLREAPVKAMSIKRLHKSIVQKCDLYVGFDVDDHEGMMSLLKKKINASSKFIMQGRKVSLASIN